MKFVDEIAEEEKNEQKMDREISIEEDNDIPLAQRNEKRLEILEKLVEKYGHDIIVSFAKEQKAVSTKMKNLGLEVRLLKSFLLKLV